MTYSLTDLEALYAKATPGEWRSNDHGIQNNITLRADFAAIGTVAHWISGVPVPQQAEWNAACITALHNAFPALAADLRRLEAERDRLRAALLQAALLQLVCILDDDQLRDSDLEDARAAPAGPGEQHG